MGSRDRCDGEAGFATIWMLGLATVTLLLVALAADGARVLVCGVGDGRHRPCRGPCGRARGRSGQPHTQPGVGRRRGTCRGRRPPDDPHRSGRLGRWQPIEVTVQTTIDLPLLALLGVPTRTVSSTATATVLQGVGPP